MELAAEYNTDPSQYVISNAQQSLDSIVRLCQKKIQQAVFDVPLQVSPMPYQWPNYGQWNRGF